MVKKNPTPHEKRIWWRKNWDKFVILFFLALLIFFYPGQNIFIMSDVPVSASPRVLPFAIPTPAPYPERVGPSSPEEITATGVVILDADSAVYLYKHNENESLPPASTTKILTALVALDTYALDDVLTVNNVITEGQVMDLVHGEKMTVENLLYGALIHSGNDAAYALADNYPGGVEKFMVAMNEKAKELHLDHSHFTNPIGFDDPSHKMTPLDLSRLAAVALTNRTIAKMVAIPQITVSDVYHTRFHQLKNVNELLGKIPGVGGIKTGWTQEAGENLVTLVERNGHRVIIVVLHSQDRFGDTEKLINWIFTAFEWKTFS